MRKLIMALVAAVALSASATGCVVRERHAGYHHVGPGPRYVAPAPRHAYDPYRDDRGYRARHEYRYYP